MRGSLRSEGSAGTSQGCRRCHRRESVGTVSGDGFKTADEVILMYQRQVAELRNALAGLDDVISWLAENDPKAMEEMPRDLWRRIGAAGAALAAGIAT